MRGVRQVIDELLRTGAPLSTREVAERARVSRQGAQKQLKALVAAGVLRVEGRARAARYFKQERLPNLWDKVRQLSDALDGLIDSPADVPVHAQARFAREQTVEVASAGSLFRLSARLLLQDVDCDVLTLDFRGVEDLGDEFVEEVFERWASAHPLTRVRVAHLQEALAPRVPATFR